jgi:hypothetical protein
MKKKVNETIKVSIPVALTEEWEVDIKWSELIATQGVLENDVFLGHTWEDKEIMGWCQSEPKTYRVPYLVLRREREETDDEFFLRLKEADKITKEKEDRERLEYLRLKAKYE